VTVCTIYNGSFTDRAFQRFATAAVSGKGIPAGGPGTQGAMEGTTRSHDSTA
jgi:hypothetical protein